MDAQRSIVLPEIGYGFTTPQISLLIVRFNEAEADNFGNGWHFESYPLSPPFVFFKRGRLEGAELRIKIPTMPKDGSNPKTMHKAGHESAETSWE